jgi:hypothetical protein
LRILLLANRKLFALEFANCKKCLLFTVSLEILILSLILFQIKNDVFEVRAIEGLYSSLNKGILEPLRKENFTNFIKGIGSILFLKNGLKKICRKNYICIDVARCFPNILDAMVLENINLSEDKIG